MSRLRSPISTFSSWWGFISSNDVNEIVVCSFIVALSLLSVVVFVLLCCFTITNNKNVLMQMVIAINQRNLGAGLLGDIFLLRDDTDILFL
jgi:hypothetical protein